MAPTPSLDHEMAGLPSNFDTASEGDYAGDSARLGEHVATKEESPDPEQPPHEAPNASDNLPDRRDNKFGAGYAPSNTEDPEKEPPLKWLPASRSGPGTAPIAFPNPTL